MRQGREVAMWIVYFVVIVVVVIMAGCGYAAAVRSGQLSDIQEKEHGIQRS